MLLVCVQGWTGSNNKHETRHTPASIGSPLAVYAV
jgi:hypothetical protein